MQTVKFKVLLLLVGLIPFTCAAKKEGKNFSVGFSYYKAQDSTRLYIYNQDTVFRPMLIHFWYPSQESSGLNKMRFKQYIDLISIRENFTKPQEDIDKESFNFVNAYAGFAKANFKIGLNTSTQEILDSPVEASLNIPLAKGGFPLIIYAPSNSKTPIQNHVICEQLAKKGYFVISVASAGENSIQRKDSGKSILAQVEDMEYLLDFVNTNIKLNYSNIGLLGYSTGGSAISIFQMKHSNVKAVLALDGSNEYSHYIHLTKIKDFNPEKAAVPYFLLVNRDTISIYPFYNSIASINKQAIRMTQIGHFGFVSFWNYFNNCKADTLQNNFAKSYDYITDYATVFFDETLKENKKSNSKLQSLRSQKNEFAIADQLDFAQSTALLNTYLKSTIDSAIAIYKAHKAESFNHSDYTEQEISIAGRMLLDYDGAAAAELFAFNTQEYPGSWHAYYDLGFSYKVNGEMELAKEVLLKALEIDPENKEVTKLLAELTSPK